MKFYNYFYWKKKFEKIWYAFENKKRHIYFRHFRLYNLRERTKNFRVKYSVRHIYNWKDRILEQAWKTDNVTKIRLTSHFFHWIFTWRERRKMHKNAKDLNFWGRILMAFNKRITYSYEVCYYFYRSCCKQMFKKWYGV